MTVIIPDDALTGLALTPEEARIEVAVSLFADGRVTLGRGAKIAGLSYSDFQRELGRRHVAVHYGIAEYEQDLTTLRAMEGQ